MTTMTAATLSEWLDEIERSHGLRSPEFRAALEARGKVVLAKPAKPAYCWCLVPEGHPLGGHTGTCCSVHRDCDLPFCYCDCSDPDDGGWGDADVPFGFADPGGRSALRAATHERCPAHKCHAKLQPNWSWCPSCGTKLNPRKHDCHCGARRVLTDEDVRLGYQCDRCADRAEGIYRGGDY